MMNINNLVFATVATAILAMAVPIAPYDSGAVDASQGDRQTQATTISLNSDDLRQPHFLRVSTAAAQLNGRIELDGKLVQTLKNSRVQIDLSPKLTQGRHILSISGEYRPTNASVQIELIGPNTQVSQQTAGSGSINQTLIIEVVE
jgi:hypothetical protein